MAIRWKKSEKETGLRAIGAGPRTWALRDAETGAWYMSVVCAYTGALGRDTRPEAMNEWYWRVQINGKWLKSKTIYPTDLEAKAAADAYFIKNKDKILNPQTPEEPSA